MTREFLDKMVILLPLLICGFASLLLNPSDAFVCYECTYTTNENASASNLPGCDQILDPTRVSTCSGPGCYSYIYTAKDQYQEYSTILRGCGELPVDASKEKCLLNTELFNITFFFLGNQCCYNMTEDNAGVTSCFCEGDYCNYNITQSAVINPTNKTITFPDSKANNTDFVNCFSCFYSDVTNNISGNLTCKEPFRSYDEGSCRGRACATLASASEGQFQIIQSCFESMENYNDHLIQCQNQNKATSSGFNYFYYENQCCYTYTYGSWSQTGCFCEGNYCNTKYFPPTVFPRVSETSHDLHNTTTSSWKNPQNATNQYNLSTTQFPWTSNNSLNSTGFVSCYSCSYSGVANDVSTNLTCEEPFVSYEGGSCGGEACATYASASDGYFEIRRTCVSTQSYTDILRSCRENATFSGFSYFFLGNQCCSIYTSDTFSSTGCLCVGNYCNTKFLQPKIVPRSNDTTTFAWYNPQNTTESPNGRPSTMPFPYGPNDSATSSNHVSCYECYYSGVSINTSAASPCGSQTNSGAGKVCSGVACQTYSYSSSSYAHIFQQCVDTVYYSAMLVKCRNGQQYVGYNYFFEGDLCCYSSHDSHADLKSCFCPSDYCNNYILQPTEISNGTTRSTWASPQNATKGSGSSTPNPRNGTGLVNCYSCWYSGVASNVPTNLSCQKPFIAYGEGVCNGGACLTDSAVSDGLVYIDQQCVDAFYYTESLGNCQNRSHVHGFDYFFEGNQCCFSDRSTDAKACFCVSDYCNNNVLLPNVTTQTTNPQATGSPINTTKMSQQDNKTSKNPTSTSRDHQNSSNQTTTLQTDNQNSVNKTTTPASDGNNPGNRTTTTPLQGTQNPGNPATTTRSDAQHPITYTTVRQLITTRPMTRPIGKPVKGSAFRVQHNGLLILIAIINILALAKAN